MKTVLQISSQKVIGFQLYRGGGLDADGIRQAGRRPPDQTDERVLMRESRG